MKIQCVRPASFSSKLTGRMMRGQIVEVPAERGLEILYGGSTIGLMSEVPVFERVRYDGPDGLIRWFTQPECSDLDLPGWKRTPRKQMIAEAKHILVHRQMGLGDMLMIMPTLRALARDQGKTVDLMTLDKYVPIFDGNPWVAKTYSYERYESEGFRVEQYDGFANLLWWVENNARNQTVPRIDLFAEGAGVTLADHQLDYAVTEQERSAAELTVEDMERPIIIWQTGSYTWKRRLPPPLIATCVEQLAGTHLISGEWDVELPAKAVNLIGRTTIRELAALTECADVAIAPDSGLAHVAAAVGTPAVVIASTIKPELRFNYYPQVTVIDSAALVGGCWCNDNCTCGHGHGDFPPCLLSVQPRRVIETVESVLAERPKKSKPSKPSAPRKRRATAAKEAATA